MTGLIDFSTDAASNDVAAPPINWAEGQPSRTVNNSAREMMAALANWRDDTNGALSAFGGAANALTIATNQIVSPATFAKPFDLAFTVDAENTGPATLSADGTPAKPILRRDGIPVGPGDLRPGPRYRVTRAPAFGDSYVLAEPPVEAAGTVRMFGSEAAVPKGWVLCDGRLLSRTSYAALFLAINGFYGTGNGSTTFAVPDLRGRAPFGADAMGGTAAGRLTGNGGLAGGVGASGGVEIIALSVAQMPAHSHGGSTAPGGAVAAGTTGGGGAHDHGGTTQGAGGHSHTGTTEGGGGHSHTGATDNGGSHVHSINHFVQGGYQGGGGGQAAAVQSIKPNGTSPNSVGQTEADGVHGHNFTTNGVGDHGHNFSTNAASNHSHGINGTADHAHATPAIPAHAHGLSIDNAGSGAAHPNMPPGLVIVFAIKA